MIQLNQQQQEWMDGIHQAWISFRFSDDFRDAIISATKASWANDNYYVELFPDGTYRILYEVGNLYNSPGLIFKVSSLGDEEFNDEDASESWFDSAEVAMDEKYEEWQNEYPNALLAYS